MAQNIGKSHITPGPDYGGKVKENARLKRLVADLTLDKQILSDVVKKKI